MPKPKLIIICGPTATGKSDLAVFIAKKIKGEIVSADSRQVYKGLDIGSGKITEKEMQGVPHHLLDVVDPKKTFTVAYFQKLGRVALDKILEKNKTPIICGGTGFYIDALVKGFVLPEVKPDPVLRKKLSKIKVEKLFLMLKKLDPKRAKNIDNQNKVRIVRAIEIAKALGKVPQLKNEEIYNTLWIGLNLPREGLQKKIKVRLLKRIDAGMIKEVKNLHKNGVSWKRLESFGLEYKYVSLYLQEKISKEEMLLKLQSEIWHYAKRQMTWFKREKNIWWTEPKNRKEVLRKIERFLK